MKDIFMMESESGKKNGKNIFGAYFSRIFEKRDYSEELLFIH